MAKPPRASPGVGRAPGANLPAQANILSALAVEIIDKEKIAEMTEARKRNRKRAEAQGVVLEDLDRLYKMKDMTAPEIEIWFKRQWNSFGAVFSGLFKQFELFQPKAEAPETEAAHRHHGFMQGITGKPNRPPPGLVGAALNEWQDGFNDGSERRGAADAARLEAMREALENADAGQAADGAAPGAKPKRGAKAAATGKQAAKDFAEDNAPDWSGFSAMPAEWTDAQRKTANAWVDSVPADVTPTIDHAGAKLFFDTKRKASGSAAPAALEVVKGGVAAPDWTDYPQDNADWSDDQKEALKVWFDLLPEGAAPEIDHVGAKAEFRRLRDGGFDIPAQPSWVGFSSDPEEWFAAQRRDFMTWYDALPADHTPHIEHPGVQAAFDAERDRAPEEPASEPKPESQSQKAERLAREAGTN